MEKKSLHPTKSNVRSNSKSFRFLGKGDPDREYRNDVYVQDFITYAGILGGCMETNIGHEPTSCNSYGSKAVVGPKGEKGKEIIEMYEFGDEQWDDDFCYCTVMVVYSDGTNEPFELKIKLKQGPPGETGAAGGMIGPTLYVDNDMGLHVVEPEHQLSSRLSYDHGGLIIKD